MKTIADNNLVSIEELVGPKENFASSDGKTSRMTESSIKLLLRTIGGPRLILQKLARLLHFFYMLINVWAVNKRLKRLHSRGLIEQIPNHKQMFFGAMDMVRYFIAPGAYDYYRSRGINGHFHQVLRFLDDPAGLMDPIGVRLSRDSIIGHVLGVVHANPVYDLQLLEMFEDGMDEMEKQTEQMVLGTHPAQKSIGSIVEDPEYHARLLEMIRRYRQNPATKPLLRRAGTLRNDPYFVLAESMYGTLPSAMRYMNRLPKTLWGLLKHSRKHKRIQPEFCDEHVVTAWQKVYGTSPQSTR